MKSFVTRLAFSFSLKHLIISDLYENCKKICQLEVIKIAEVEMNVEILKFSCFDFLLLLRA